MHRIGGRKRWAPCIVFLGRRGVTPCIVLLGRGVYVVYSGPASIMVVGGVGVLVDLFFVCLLSNNNVNINKPKLSKYC